MASVAIAPASVHHSSAMRSGPSARPTRCTHRRQVKWKGGSSGKSHDASIGSGGANSRTGRGDLLRSTRMTPSPPFWGEREGPSAKRWEGEAGVGKRSGIPHLTPALSAPGDGEGERKRRFVRPFR